MTQTNHFSPSSFGETKNALLAAGKIIDDAETWRLNDAADHFVDRLMGERRLKTAASVIWHYWPGLRLAACRFVEHVGPRFPGETGPLVDEVLVAAVQAYVKNVDTARADAAAAAFLNTLANAADTLLMQQVIAIGRGGHPVNWPHFGLAMTDWLDVIGALIVYTEGVPYLTSAEVSGGRDFLAYKVMGHREYGLMKGGSLHREKIQL